MKDYSTIEQQIEKLEAYNQKVKDVESFLDRSNIGLEDLIKGYEKQKRIKDNKKAQLRNAKAKRRNKKKNK